MSARRAVDIAAERVSIGITDPALFREVRRTGLNMNQIAHGQNAGWTIGNRRFEDALILFTAVYRRIQREFD